MKERSKMLISSEYELPVVDAQTFAPARQEQFALLWDELGNCGWERNGWGVKRPYSKTHEGCIAPGQFVTTDTGPTIEFTPSPAETIQEIHRQANGIRSEIIRGLAPQNLVLLGSGVHPTLGTSRKEYYDYRSPRKAYDYAIEERGWEHRSILNIAATQEVIDVSFDKAIRVLRCCHRLAGPFLFLFRNDPDYQGIAGKRLSVRPEGWRWQSPRVGKYAIDHVKFLIPQKEICSWKDYLQLLWHTTPMFFLGTKNDGPVFVPRHPTFWEFLTESPKEGWNARRIVDNQEFLLVPDASHAEGTDWSYMGFARLRFKFTPTTFDVTEIKSAWNDHDRVDEYMSRVIGRLLIENRSVAAAPPGEEYASLAFLTGLLENLDETYKFLSRYSYSFWLNCAQMAENLPFTSSIDGEPMPYILLQLLDIATDGLKRRGFAEESYLQPLVERLARNQSPAEKALEIFSTQGMKGVIKHLSYQR